MKKVIMFILLLLLLPMAYSVKPLTEVSTSLTDGYDIKIPKFEALKKAQSYDFNFHVYNKSNGLPIYKDINCYFHLYGKNGKHILELEDDTSSNIFDYSFNINGNNFSKVGIYYYSIQCNSSNYGGFSSSEFEVTHYGASNDYRGYNNIAMIIGFSLMALLFIYFAFNLDNSHFLLKILLIFFAIYCLMSMPKVMIQSYHGFQLFLNIPLWFFRIFITYFFIYLSYHWLMKFEKFANMIDKMRGGKP